MGTAWMLYPISWSDLIFSMERIGAIVGVVVSVLCYILGMVLGLGAYAALGM